jgi:hypothetical protein
VIPLVEWLGAATRGDSRGKPCPAGSDTARTEGDHRAQDRRVRGKIGVMRSSAAALGLLLTWPCLLGCQAKESNAAAGGNGGGGLGGAGITDDSASFRLTSYPDGAGDLALVPISVNGSPSFGVLLDTGSDGLRVFRDALQGTTIEVSDAAVSVEFGYGNQMAGHLATAEVAFGEVKTPEPIALHLVDSFQCAPDVPACDFAGGEATVLTDAGVYGILGVSTRAGFPAVIYSPFAQLGERRSRGFIIRTGGFGSAAGEVLFGLAEEAVAGFATVSLSAMGTHPNGLPAWRDDAVQTCFSVDDAAVVPRCSETVFDTGSSVDVIYAPSLPSSQVSAGALAPGVEFRAQVEPALDMSFTVGATPSPSFDLVFVDDTIPFALLGMGVFYRHDVLFDLHAGALGFRPL